MADTLIQGTTIIEDKRSARGEIWSCPGNNFQALSPDSFDMTYLNASDVATGVAETTGAGINLVAAVFLPNGVTITGVITYSDVSTESWTLKRINISTGVAEILATASLNTEDTSITSSTVDNDTYAYLIGIEPMDASDEIWGARIKYEF